MSHQDIIDEMVQSFTALLELGLALKDTREDIIAYAVKNSCAGPLPRKLAIQSFFNEQT